MMGITDTVPTGKLCDKGNFRGRNLCTAERAKKGEKMTKPDRWSGLGVREGADESWLDSAALLLAACVRRGRTATAAGVAAHRLTKGLADFLLSRLLPLELP